MHQLDVNGAFIHATLPDKDQMSIRLPNISGAASADGHIVKLVQSLNGLHPAPTCGISISQHCLVLSAFDAHSTQSVYL